MALPASSKQLTRTGRQLVCPSRGLLAFYEQILRMPQEPAAEYGVEQRTSDDNMSKRHVCQLHFFARLDLSDFRPAMRSAYVSSLK
jgi:hypothetical protein